VTPCRQAGLQADNAYAVPGELDQIQFLLRHVSIADDERL